MAECPICGRETGLPGWAQKAITEAIEAEAAVARAQALEEAVSLAEICEFLRGATRWDPGTGRDRHLSGFRAAADELEREFGA